jgi:hypothetical protein
MAKSFDEDKWWSYFAVARAALGRCPARGRDQISENASLGVLSGGERRPRPGPEPLFSRCRDVPGLHYLAADWQRFAHRMGIAAGHYAIGRL